ncbi:MAG: PqqD family protein [Methanosarcinales archaeon]
MTVMDLEKPLKREKLRCKEIDGETILYLSNTNSVHVLNKTASLIWSLCDGQHDIKEMAKIIASRYNADENKILKDVQEAIDEFQRLDLLKNI